MYNMGSPSLLSLMAPTYPLAGYERPVLLYYAWAGTDRDVPEFCLTSHIGGFFP